MTDKTEAISLSTLHAPYLKRVSDMKELRADLSKLADEFAGLRKVAGGSAATETTVRGMVADIDHWLAQPLPLPHELLRNAQPAGDA